jgi:hypothetical protein
MPKWAQWSQNECHRLANQITQGAGAPLRRADPNKPTARPNRADLLRRGRSCGGGRSLGRRRSWRLSATRRRSRSRSWCFPPRLPKHAVDQRAVVLAMVPLRLNHDQDGSNHDQDQKNPHSNTLPVPARVTYTNRMKTKRAGARPTPSDYHGSPNAGQRPAASRRGHAP